MSGIESFEMYTMIDHMKPHHLTVGKLKKLRKARLELAIFDRNMEDGKIWTYLKPKKNYKPEHFFSETRHKVTYNGGHTWQILFEYADGKSQLVEHNLEVDYSHVQKLSNSDHDCLWHPVDCDGYIDGIYWKDLPDDVRIGWRGPAMLWKDLKSYSGKYKVYYLDPSEEESGLCTIL